jgi:AraC family transcriptional regulator
VLILAGLRRLNTMNQPRRSAIPSYPLNPAILKTPVRLEIASRRPRPAAEIPSQEQGGVTVAAREVRGFQVVEIDYPAGLELSRHSHPNAHLLYVLDGEYVESCAGASEIRCQARALRYLPPNFERSNHFESGARCLIVSIDPEMFARVASLNHSLEHPASIETPVSMWLTQKLYREFQQGDSSSTLSLEGILLELLAETARHAGSGPVRIVPEWLRVARAYVEANYLRALSLADIARVAHVHRVHLARQFRSYFSTSVGEFLRRKRVEHACHLVSTTNCSLAEVAIDCGFSDQSHFSATFRKMMGLTPARFREMANAQDRPSAKLAYVGK